MTYRVDVPEIRPTGWEEALVKECFAVWVSEEINPIARSKGVSPQEILRRNFRYLKIARESLDNPQGLSKDKHDRSQRALMAPQFCENWMAARVGSDWQRTYPRLWKAFYEFFPAGHMGKYAGTGDSRDFGAALTEGDKD